MRQGDFPAGQKPEDGANQTYGGEGDRAGYPYVPHQ